MFFTNLRPFFVLDIYTLNKQYNILVFEISVLILIMKMATMSLI